MRPSRSGTRPPCTLLGKLAASVATVAAAGGLMAFAHYGSFGDGHAPFPRSGVAHR
jgi:hypothetical protein